MGIPIARLADVSNRRAIIAAGVFLWSLMTVLCGLAKSFGQLFAARIGVGIGEAALSPPAFSLFTDYFPPGKVTRAIAVFSGGGFLGAGLAYIIGGYVVDFVTRLDVVYVPVFGQLRAWQMAFIVVGLPGILLALLVLSLREPARRGLLGDQPGKVPRSIPIREIIVFLRKNRRTYGHHFIGASLFVMLAHAVLSWAPVFFMRKFGWTPGEVGLIYGSTLLIFGTSGVVGAGWIADALRRRGYTDANLRVVIIGTLCCTPFGAAAFLVDDTWLAVALMAPFTFLWGPAARYLSCRDTTDYAQPDAGPGHGTVFFGCQPHRTGYRSDLPRPADRLFIRRSGPGRPFPGDRGCNIGTAVGDHPVSGTEILPGQPGGGRAGLAEVVK